MTEEEKYKFDVLGYVKIENAIPAADLAAMNAFLNAKEAADPEWQGRAKHTGWENVLTWGPEFRALLDNAATLPYLRELLGDNLRLDHDYAVFMTAGGTGLRLHGGGMPYDPTQFYHVFGGKMYNGLTTAAFALTDVPEGAGGFACVPGSHKSYFECPEDIRRFERDDEIVRHVPTKAGDCIVFTEALLHGTAPWKANHTRRTIFLKYSPGYMSWGRDQYFLAAGNPQVQALMAELTERQRALLAPPSVYEHKPVPKD